MEVKMREMEGVKKIELRYQRLRQQVIQASPLRPGLQTISRYANAIDHLLSEVFKKVQQTQKSGTAISKQLTLLAQGGYGRRELNLYSDIDLVFLSADEISPNIEEFIKAILYILWDLNLEVGYFVRTIPETEQLLGKDLASTTAMLEARFLAGNLSLFRTARKIVKQYLGGELQEWFLRQRLADIERRHEKWGSSVYLLEPNIKEGIGGLRDVHSMLWLGFPFWAKLDLVEFINRHFITTAEEERLKRALNFLHRLRNSLHLLSQRKDDLLSFEKQSRIAKILNYHADEFSLAEEKLMKSYYHHARFVEALTTRVIDELLWRYRPEFSRLSHPEKKKEKLGKYFWMSKGWLSIDPKLKTDVLAEPMELLAMFKLCAEKELQLDNDAITEVSNALPHLDKRFRRQPQARDIFLEILSYPGGAAKALRDMHRTGFLEAFIPEFKRLHCLVRLDFYHKYTVDEHLLRCIEVSESLRQANREKKDRHPADLVKLAQKISLADWSLLNLALLLHDIGKGKGHGHVLLGAQLVRRILNRFALPQQQQEIIHFLVSHHQLLSHVALRRNLDEPQVAESVAKEIADPKLLDLLYLLTYCDIKAVAPDSWNEWKAQLLYELYRRTANYLKKGKMAPLTPLRPPAKVADLLAHTLQKLTGTTPSRPRLINFVNNLPERYLTTVAIERSAEHFLLMSRLKEDNLIEIAVHHPAQSKLTEICFVTTDRPGLFRDLCLILSSSGINIINAQIFTTTDGFCFDVFQVTDYYGRVLPEGFRYDLLKKDFIDLTSQRKPVEFFLKRQRRPRPLSPERFKYLPTKVSLNNELSLTHSVLEVKTVDRPWVLYTITSILREEDANIDLAIITTEAYRVVDVFYITDLENNKIDDESHIQRIVDRLTDALQNPDLQSFLLPQKTNQNLKS